MAQPGPVGPRHPGIQRLRRLSRRRSARLDERAFVIDGPVLLAVALEAGVEVREVLVEPGGEGDAVDAAVAAGVPIRHLAAGTLARATDTVTPQPVAAVAALPDTPVDVAMDVAAGSPITLVLAGVSDPGNVGTLLRVAEAAGARAVLFCDSGADPWNPKCVRASAGAVFHVTVGIGGDAVKVLDGLQRRGVRTAATVVRGGVAYDEADLTGPLALVLGNEAHGLAGSLADAVDLHLSIPMVGRTESLNVAMAGSVVAFEALRQRRLAEGRTP
jgi:RNA methyltransferase, TrmH family